MSFTQFYQQVLSKGEGREWVTFVLEGVFDGQAAWEVRKAYEAIDDVDEIVLDFSNVTEFYDFGVAVIAHGLQKRPSATPPVTFRGLKKHQRRMFAYFGVSDHFLEATK